MIALAFIGQTGSGKTTLAKSAAEALGLERISSGDIARDLAKTDAYARAGLERGDWAPELAMREEVTHRIEAATVATGDFVIEGFPRRLEQLYILESIPDIRPIYFVLECDPLLCLRRLIHRKRDGDHPDAVATRWRAYQEFTEPMVEAIFNQAITLEGSMPVEDLRDVVAATYQRLKVDHAFL